MHVLAVYVKEGLRFARGIALENSKDSQICFWLALLPPVLYFFFSFDHCLCLYAKLLTLFRLRQVRLSQSTYLLTQSPPKIRGGEFLFLKFGQRRVMNNCSEIGGGGGQLKGEGSLKRGGFQVVLSVFVQKSKFSSLLEYFFFPFFSGKYSCLL